MAGTLKRTAANGSTIEEFAFPGRLIPLAVFGSWLMGSWKDVGEKNGWFGCEGRSVVYHTGTNGHTSAATIVGKLPAGWACADLHHHRTDDSGFFVGRSEDVAEAERLLGEIDRLDDRIGAMMHRV
jgi:hypothetical protein